MTKWKSLGIGAAVLSANLWLSGPLALDIWAQDQVLRPESQAAASKDPPSPREPAVDGQRAHLDSFDKVWQTVHDVHWDEAIAHGKWVELRDTYRARAERASSLEELRSVIQQMIGELEQSHFTLIPQESYAAIESGKSGFSTCGITVRVIDQEAVVTKVVESSAAAEAGISVGWTVESIDDTQVQDILKQIHAAAAGPTRFETLAAVALNAGMCGNDGDELRLAMKKPDQATADFCLRLSEPSGNIVKFGNLNPMKVTHECKTLDGSIGYFAFNLFLDPATIMPAYREAVHRAEHSNGLILDLRGNIGGIGAMTMGMASELSDRRTKLGTMTMKSGAMDFAVNASPDPVDCPVAVLIDEMSISSAEVFSGGLQDIGAARIFGGRSAGLALPAQVIKLPNGDGFMFAVANYVSVSGKRLEVDGVVPDESIPLSRELLLSDPDPVLSRAIEWISAENQKKDSKGE